MNQGSLDLDQTSFVYQNKNLLFKTYLAICYQALYETMVWPNFFLMNVFFALKGSKLVIIICMFCAYVRPSYQVMSAYWTIDPLVSLYHLSYDVDVMQWKTSYRK